MSSLQAANSCLALSKSSGAEPGEASFRFTRAFHPLPPRIETSEARVLFLGDVPSFERREAGSSASNVLAKMPSTRRRGANLVPKDPSVSVPFPFDDSSVGNGEEYVAAFSLSSKVIFEPAMTSRIKFTVLTRLSWMTARHASDSAWRALGAYLS